MLQIDSSLRPSAHKILQHRYFDEIRNSDLTLYLKPQAEKPQAVQ